MLLLILGLILWSGAHYFKRLAPDARAKMGSAGRGVVGVLVLASVVMMVFGYKWAAFIPVWSPPSFLTHLNNLLMVLGLYVYLSSAALPGKVWIASKLKNPQLTGVKIWALAHLLVNGDLASIILFGGLMAWAVGSVILIKRGGDTFDRSRAPIKSEIRFAIVVAIVFAIVAIVHGLVGPSPFG